MASTDTTTEAPAPDIDEPPEAAPTGTPTVGRTEAAGEGDSRADRVERDAMVPHPRPEPSSYVAPGLHSPSETIDLGTLDPEER